jgi:hypothetical protein
VLNTIKYSSEHSNDFLFFPKTLERSSFQYKIVKMITGREGLSIAELVVYVPSLLLALLVAKRHGFSRDLGWIYLAVFALVRATGSALELASISNGSSSLGTIAVILSSIGLSPLLLSMCGLLKRL